MLSGRESTIHGGRTGGGVRSRQAPSLAVSKEAVMTSIEMECTRVPQVDGDPQLRQDDDHLRWPATSGTSSSSPAAGSRSVRRCALELLDRVMAEITTWPLTWEKRVWARAVEHVTVTDNIVGHGNDLMFLFKKQGSRSATPTASPESHWKEEIPKENRRSPQSLFDVPLTMSHGTRHLCSVSDTRRCWQAAVIGNCPSGDDLARMVFSWERDVWYRPPRRDREAC